MRRAVLASRDIRSPIMSRNTSSTSVRVGTRNPRQRGPSSQFDSSSRCSYMARRRGPYRPRREEMRTKATLAIGLCCVACLVILSVLHSLEPEFNPPHLISEYQLGRFGWLMSLAFFCLGAASLALFPAARQEIHTRPGTFGTWGLLVLGVAYFCAGIFPADPKWFVSSLLHASVDWSSSSARPWCLRW
jgi:Protein of unknown function (DUF998)